MRISVVLPCHNAAPYIAQALASIEAQTVAPYEVIVVNDASTDGSADQIRASTVPTKIINIAARNLSAARNAAIGEAKGDWVAFLDADDIWLPTHLEQASAVLANSRDVAYMAHYDLLTMDGERVRVDAPVMDSPRSGLSPAMFLELFARGMPHSCGTYVLSTSRTKDVGGCEETQVRREDIDLWLRVITGATWGYSPVAAMAYRTGTPGSLSKNVPERNYYLLRALIRNEASYSGPVMEALLHDSAIRTLRTACTQGTTEDRLRARQLGWSYLTRREQALWSGLLRCHGLLHAAHRIMDRRRIKAGLA